MDSSQATPQDKIKEILNEQDLQTASKLPQTIGLFATPEDRGYITKFKEVFGPFGLKASFKPVEYFAAFAVICRTQKLTDVIVTDPDLLQKILEADPSFRQGFNKKGQKKNATLDEYQGSFIEIPGTRIGRGIEEPLNVLILNPLQHLYTVPYAPFIFKRLLTKITAPQKWFPQTKFTWELVTKDTPEDRIQRIYERFHTALLISCDIETTVDSPHRTIECSGYCALFPDGTSHTVVLKTIDSFEMVLWMRKFNKLPAPKVLQNGLYDNLYYLRYNSPLDNWLFDTQHIFHAWYSELPKRLDFISIFACRRVRYWKDDGKTGGSYEFYEYNAKDCWATLNSWLSLLLEIPEWARKNYLIEFPLVFPCLHCEADGLSIDKEAFDKSAKEAEEKLRPLENKLAAWISPSFNPGSPLQVKNLLKVLGCADKYGNVDSSDEKALNRAAAVHPLNEVIVSTLLGARKQRKLISTYLQWDKFWLGRLYYKLNPAGTDSGRLNSSEGSFWCGLQIQNIPRGPAIKRFIVADEGWLLAEGDYAQSEARCVGYISGCTSLINLVESTKDYHSVNVERFFGVAYEKVYDDEKRKTIDSPLRDLSKRVNHGSSYNMGAVVLLDTMGPKKVAEAKRILKLPAPWTLIQVCQYLLDQYARAYPEIKEDYYKWVDREIGMTNKLVSQLGWTRYFFSKPSSSKMALNAAVAHVPQNLSVSIINPVFYKIWRASVYGDLRGLVRVKAQIHDSILYCYKGETTPQIVQERMKNPIEVVDVKGVKRTMLIPPDMSYGKRSWAELK